MRRNQVLVEQQIRLNSAVMKTKQELEDVEAKIENLTEQRHVLLERLISQQNSLKKIIDLIG